MERPERPSRHKSKPVKYPIRPSFSSDSDSEMNDGDVFIPETVSIYEAGFPNTNVAGPSTSTSTSSAHPNTQESTSNNNFMDVAQEVVIGASSSPEPARRKRTAKSMAASSAAAACIFDSVDSLIGNSSSRPNRGDSPENRFQHTDFVIRPRSFCAIECMRTPGYKWKRPSCPIDLTPSSSTSRDLPGSSLNTFGLRDSTTLAANAEAAQSSLFKSSLPIPLFSPVSQPRGEQQSTSSRILSQFDEICAYPSTNRRRSRGHFVRFLESGRFEGPSGESGPSNTSSSNRQQQRSGNSGSVDDYSELVNNFFLNPYPTSLNNSENQRSPTGTEAGPSDPLRVGSLTEEDLPRTPSHEEPPARQETHDDLLSSITSYLPSSPSQPPRNVHEGEGMDQSNEDVIVLCTPERPVSPDFVPSSRSPSPMPMPVYHPVAKKDKPQQGNVEEVPMTLQELNQTLVSLLECPVCLDHATPPIYQCSKGHIMCQNCHPRLTQCPICRTRLPGDRNSAMEKVAEKLMYPCKNTVTGCSQMLKLDDKRKHEEGCGFRHYACIDSNCRWKGYKPELVVHLQSTHPEKLLTGDVKEVQIPLGVPGANNMFSSHHWVQSAHNEVFNVIFNIDHFKRMLKGCVIFIGSPDRACKFTYKFELKQQVSPFRTLSYSRATHTDILKPGQPLLLSSSDFNINIDMALIYRTDSSPPNSVPIHISILQA